MRRFAVALLIASVGLAGLVWLTRRLPEPAVPAPGAVLRHVTLLEPGAAARPGMTLTVTGERIAALAPTAPDEPPGPFAGRFVLPGLVDLHVHHPPGPARGERRLFGQLMLLHGVTSVRDTGSFFGDLWAHRERIARGEFPGPRIFACGRLLDGAPATWPGAREVPDAGAAERAVAELADAGADCVKVYNGLEASALEAIRRTAAARGLPVVAHVPWSATLNQLDDAEVEHLMGLTYDWRDVSAGSLHSYVNVSRARGIAHTPTLVAFARAAQLDRYPLLRDSREAALLPPHWRELAWNPALNPVVGVLAPGQRPDARSRPEAMQTVVAALHAAGVPIRVGTDTMRPFVVPGAALHAELELLADSGLGVEGAWAAATRGAGEALGVPGLGTLAPGAPADLLVFREDPVHDLAGLATLEAVVAGGRLYTREQLERNVAEERAALEAWPYRVLARWAVRLGLRMLPDS